ncbi:MAG: transglutaminase domain-containing protein [Candidatus Hydrogenedentes bacterium]|nr:transglutaminase domain-containing protein [Candidatus Hydrogenedentota bacterium]
MKPATHLALFIFLLGMAALATGCRQEPPDSKIAQEAPAPDPAPASTPRFPVLELDTDAGARAYFKALPPGERLDVLDAALARIFPKCVANPGEREVLAVLSYVGQVLKLKSSARHLGSEVLAEGQAYCYGMARAFEALCRRMGLPARINAVHNFDYMQAHNMAEVYYGGQWHFFDPTYGVFFYDRENYDGAGRILSARELFSGSVSSRFAFMTCDPLWTGNYNPGQVPKLLPDDFRYRGAFTLRQLYDQVLAVGFPFIQSDANTSSFPIDIDMGNTPQLAIGTVNGAFDDVEGCRENGTCPRYHGAPFLGSGSTGFVFHTLTVKSAAPARFKMTYHFLRGSRFEAMGVLELRDVIIERQESRDDTWSVWFRLQSAEGLFLAINRRDVAILDAITVERLQ